MATDPAPNTQASTDLHNEALRMAKEQLGPGAPLSSVLRLAADIYRGRVIKYGAVSKK